MGKRNLILCYHQKRVILPLESLLENTVQNMQIKRSLIPDFAFVHVEFQVFGKLTRDISFHFYICKIEVKDMIQIKILKKGCDKLS